MDIVYKGKQKDFFRCVVAGEVFKYGEGIYMRIETITNTDIWYNAVNLNSGSLASFSDNDAIELVDAQLTLS